MMSDVNVRNAEVPSKLPLINGVCLFPSSPNLLLMSYCIWRRLPLNLLKIRNILDY